eukprot:scaffold60185_cov58-Phaeocystis_antarctica.AAC.1
MVINTASNPSPCPSPATPSNPSPSTSTSPGPGPSPSPSPSLSPTLLQAPTAPNVLATLSHLLRVPLPELADLEAIWRGATPPTLATPPFYPQLCWPSACACPRLCWPSACAARGADPCTPPA